MMRYKFLRYPGGKSKAVTFSYDDGVKQDVRFAETLTKYGLKGTFNFNSFTMRGEHGISPEDAKRVILDKGHEIAVHGYNHRAEGTLRPIEGIREIVDNRLELEKIFGMIIRGMAYPDSGITYFANGASYADVKRYLTDLDICYSRTLGSDNNSFTLPSDWLAWMPTCHHNNPKVLEWIDEFINLDTSTKSYCARRQPRLFYIWGHSYEFENNKNNPELGWTMIEGVMQKLSAEKDIWKATNGDVYRYVEATKLVEVTEMSVKNNSDMTVYYNINGQNVEIAPGATFTIGKNQINISITGSFSACY